jgi:tetratricopeptide (TPR) repeat protein
MPNPESCSHGHPLSDVRVSGDCPVCSSADESLRQGDSSTDHSVLMDELPPPPDGLHQAGHQPGFGRVETAVQTPQEGERSAELSRQSGPGPIGGYDILSELGRGGMGVVYKARHRALNRVVALKVVRAGAGASATDLDRFRTEAEAVAALQHPNIVQIFEVGEWNKLPYCALEYAEGGSLRDAVGGRPVPPRIAAEWVEQLARAAHYAHEQGIIHRDLKPANVLLSKRPSDESGCRPVEPASSSSDTSVVLKISDFGLAKRFERDSGLTGTGAVMGTPNYMAPEQAGQARTVGPPADIWALAAILYDLLTGRPPFLGTDAVSTMLAVRMDDPVSPRRLQPKVPADLETIALKGLEKDPSRRYPTAMAMADDLRRFLAGEPIAARPAGWGERVLKWGRRRPAAAALIAVSTTAAVTLTIFGVGYLRNLEAHNRDLTNANDTITRERDTANRLRLLAEKARNRMFDVLDAMTSGITEDSLVTQKAITNQQKRFLADVLTYYQEFADETGNDEPTRRRVAVAANSIGLIENRLGRKAESAAAFRKTRDRFAALAEDYPLEAEYRRHLAGCLNNLGLLLIDLGERTEAEACYRAGLALRQKLYDDQPGDRRDRLHLAASHLSIAGLLQLQRKWRDAELSYRAGMALQQKLIDEFPEVLEYREHLAASHMGLGGLFEELEKYAEAEVELLAAMALRRKLADDFPDEPDCRRYLAASHQSLGPLLFKLGKRSEAEGVMRTAVSLRQQLADNYPSVPSYRYQLAESHNDLGIVLNRLKKWPAAEASYRTAKSLWKSLADDSPKNSAYRSQLAVAHANLGMLFVDMEKWPAAEAEYRAALALESKLIDEFRSVPTFRMRFAGNQTRLGNLLTKQKRELEAEAAYREAVSALEKLVEVDADNFEYRIELGGTACNLGQLLRDGGKPTESISFFDRAIAALGPTRDRPYLQNAYLGRAKALTLVARYPDAVKDWDRAIEMDDGPAKDEFRIFRAKCLAHTDPVGAVAEAEKLTNGTKPDSWTPQNHPDCLYAAAGAFSIASAKLTTKAKEHAAARAVALLGQLREARYFDRPGFATYVVKDPDFEPVRSRADFRTFASLVMEHREMLPPPRPVVR